MKHPLRTSGVTCHSQPFGRFSYHATIVYIVVLTFFNRPVERRSDPQGSTKVFVQYVALFIADSSAVGWHTTFFKAVMTFECG